MPNLEDDLRSTADAIAGDAAQLAALEEEKAGLDADDPRMIELSAEAEQLARSIVPKTQVEHELAEDAEAT